ncbi:MAG: RnfABCDGE type electron transport complex subunit D [Acholeplasmataceae bacterium]|nr:RnfABCDGE type electron transport complex subunit D [Acholeplasmataceae bacterium]
MNTIETNSQEIKQETPRVNHKNLIIMSILLVVLLLVGAFVYTFYVLLMGAVAIVTALVIEYVFARVRKLDYGKDIYGAFVTPLIFTLLMPPELPLYMVVIGVGFGVFMGKSIFGGLGHNIFNPALVGYLFLLVTFPVQVGQSFIDPSTGELLQSISISDLTFTGTIDHLLGLMLGQYANTIGSTVMAAVWIIGAILLFLKIADWKIPLTILVASAAFTVILGRFYPEQFHDAFFSLFLGQLMFAAFFVATDPVSGPQTTRGKILYGIGIALITVVIRGLADAAEGVVYAIIIMNAVSPMLEKSLKEEDES